jgi:thiol-disulfide isomerase/thioredoxin
MMPNIERCLLYCIVLAVLLCGIGVPVTTAVVQPNEREIQHHVRVVSIQELLPLLVADDTLLVVNFWATWCKPCVEELPYFLALPTIMQNVPIRTCFVSLDSQKDFQQKLVPFVQRRMGKSTVLNLVEPKPSLWIPKVDPEWSGSIPCTILFWKQKRKLFEQEFSKAELSKVIQQFIAETQP